MTSLMWTSIGASLVSAAVVSAVVVPAAAAQESSPKAPVSSAASAVGPAAVTVPASFVNYQGYFSDSLNSLGCRKEYEGRSTDPWTPVVLCMSQFNPQFNAKLKSLVAQAWGNPAAAASWQREANRRAYMVAICEKLTPTAPSYYLDATLGGALYTNQSRGRCLVNSASMEYHPVSTASRTMIRVA